MFESVVVSLVLTGASVEIHARVGLGIPTVAPVAARVGASFLSHGKHIFVS